MLCCCCRRLVVLINKIWIWNWRFVILVGSLLCRIWFAALNEVSFLLNVLGFFFFQFELEIWGGHLVFRAVLGLEGTSKITSFLCHVGHTEECGCPSIFRALKERWWVQIEPQQRSGLFNRHLRSLRWYWCSYPFYSTGGELCVFSVFSLRSSNERSEIPDKESSNFRFNL